FEEELGLAGTPPLMPFGLAMCAPVLLRFGSEAQKKRFLPRIYNGEDFWCQGYSEPGSGSDLASLKTKALRRDDHYVVNGQKIWTTLAHYADWIFCLVRTDPSVEKRQEGISFLLIDMKTPGITVRPLILEARWRDGLSRVEVELMALEITNLRFLDRMRRSGEPPGADVSMLKIKGTEIQQALAELMMQAAGPEQSDELAQSAARR